MIRNLPETWDHEVDWLSIGSGIGGLSAAIAAHDGGLSAMVIERADQVGGVTALSMGEVWVAGNHHEAAIGVEDSVDSGFRYLQRLSMGYGSDAAILNLVANAHAALKWYEDAIGLTTEVIRDCPDYYYGVTNDGVAEGRMLEVAPFDAQTLGDWREKTRLSPTMPYGLTHGEIFAAGGVANIANWDYALMGQRLTDDVRCLGCGLAGYFVKGVLDRGIAMLTGTSGEELICDGTRVVGVRAVQGGKDVFIRANKGVLVAVSSYERNPDFSKTLSQQLELGSMVFSAVDGAHFRMVGPVGARIARVPDITSLGFVVPGEEDEEGKPIWRSALQVIGQPHMIVVNGAGKRFGNEAFYRQFYYKIDEIDGLTQTHPNFPCWLVLDSQGKDKYPVGSIMPGQDWPDGLGAVAGTIAELARKIGIDPDSLARTVAHFNIGAAAGEDPDFGRGRQLWSHWMCGDPNQKPNPNLGTLEKGPFYAIQLNRLGGSAITSSGILADNNGQALDWTNQPIPGLYVGGNSLARMETGAVMQSGISNARGMTMGWLAAKHAAGQPSELLAREAQRLGV